MPTPFASRGIASAVFGLGVGRCGDGWVVVIAEVVAAAQLEELELNSIK